MKNNRLLYILIFILMVWCAILSSDRFPKNNREVSGIVNQYEVDGFSTDLTKVVDEVSSGVVTVNADGNIQSGFVYRQEDENVYIVTAYHGVSNVNGINVTLGSTYTVSAELIGHDIFTDVAVLRASTPYIIEPLKLGDATLLKKGEFLLCIGTPVSMDYQGSAELAMVSSPLIQLENSILTDEERYIYFLNMIQLNSQLVPGYSGSPLFDMGGEVVGMTTMSSNNNLSFSLTSNEVKIVADQLIATGQVSRRFPGIKGTYLQDMHNYEKSALNIPLDSLEGLYVTRIRETGLAYLAGVRNGDVIVSIDGEEIRDLSSYLKAVYTAEEDIDIVFIRNGERMTGVIEND